MKKIHLLLFVALICLAGFDAQAQRRYRHHQHRHSGWALRSVARPLLWGFGPRVIITTPPLIVGRSYGYRRAYERGYEEGRRRRYEREDYEEGRNRQRDYEYNREDRRYDDEYRRPNDRNQQAPSQPKSNRNYDEEVEEQQNN